MRNHALRELELEYQFKRRLLQRREKEMWKRSIAQEYLNGTPTKRTIVAARLMEYGLKFCIGGYAGFFEARGSIDAHTRNILLPMPAVFMAGLVYTGSVVEQIAQRYSQEGSDIATRCEDTPTSMFSAFPTRSDRLKRSRETIESPLYPIKSACAAGGHIAFTTLLSYAVGYGIGKMV